MAVWGKGLLQLWMGMLMFTGGLYLQIAEHQSS